MQRGFILFLMLAWVPRAITGGVDCVGDGDLDGDAVVGLADFAAFLPCVGGPLVTSPPNGCSPAVFNASTLDLDSDVDMRDFFRLLELFGSEYFPYGAHRTNEEAELLAMNLSGQLRAPDDEYDRISFDLQRIREDFPSLTGVIDDPDNAPEHLIVDLIPGAPLGEYKALNDFYFYTDEDLLFGTTRLLYFCDNLNALVLAQEYSALSAINYAEPDWFAGTDDRIEISVLPDQTYVYSIDDGFHDCFDGCDCHRLWEIEVDDTGVVTLVSYTEQGLPWCEF